jgi:predicted alpha/beta-fold hydrolase
MGNNIEIYGVGFSLGANHLLRYLGAHYEDNRRIKTAISVSNPFDVLSTCILLKFKFFGLYDRAIRDLLAKPFIE